MEDDHQGDPNASRLSATDRGAASSTIPLDTPASSPGLVSGEQAGPGKDVNDSPPLIVLLFPACLGERRDKVAFNKGEEKLLFLLCPFNLGEIRGGLFTLLAVLLSISMLSSIDSDELAPLLLFLSESFTDPAPVAAGFSDPSCKPSMTSEAGSMALRSGMNRVIRRAAAKPPNYEGYVGY